MKMNPTSPMLRGVIPCVHHGGKPPGFLQRGIKGLSIILASRSPYRRALLASAGVRFTAVESGYREDLSLPLPPRDLAKTLAAGKAEAVAGRLRRDAIVVGADTVVAFHGQVFGKPRGRADAARTLRRFSGKRVEVITGLAVLRVQGGRIVARQTRSVTTRVFFKKLTARDIAAYVATGEPLDKAGAFAIQGGGAGLIKKIDGPRDSAIGLPVRAVLRAIKECQTPAARSPRSARPSPRP